MEGGGCVWAVHVPHARFLGLMSWMTRREIMFLQTLLAPERESGWAVLGYAWVGCGALGCVLRYVFGVACGCWERAASSPQRCACSVISIADDWLFDDIPAAAPGGCSCANTADSVHWPAPFSAMVWSMPCLCVFTCSCSVHSAHKLRRCTPLGACLPPHCARDRRYAPPALIVCVALFATSVLCYLAGRVFSICWSHDRRW